MNKENFNRGSGFYQRLFYMLKEVMWMANKIFSARVKNKRDIEANWESKNPVLLDGEIIVVTTTSGDTRFKVGDGKKTYNKLPFQDQGTRDLIPPVESSLSSTSTNPVQNKVIKSELDKKAERDVVSATANGLMSVADKNKLDGIATGANKTVVDSAISATSTNPVQNQVLKAELDGKLDKSGGTLTGNLTGKYITGTWLQATSTSDLGKTPGKISVLDDSGLLYYRTPAEIKSDIGADVVVTTSSNGLMSASDKSKLNGIASGATKTIIDTALDGTSTNPVQNKVVKAALDKKFNTTGGTIAGNVAVNGSLRCNEIYFSSYLLSDKSGKGFTIEEDPGTFPAGVSGERLRPIRVATPTNNDEAATKKYVDDAIKAYVDSAITVAINSSY